MFRDLPRYGSYKVAGEWVVEVPRSWGWEPARTIFSERKDAGHVEEQMLSVTIGRGVIPQTDLLSSTSKKDSSNVDKSKYKLVGPGDVVYNKMRAWQGAAGGSNYRGIVSPAYVVMSPREALTEYMHYVVRTPQFAKEAERWSYGITSDQWSLRPEHFKMIRFPLPPIEEQAAIVKYLAHANARIDKAISAKRGLTTLLDEQKIVIARGEIDRVVGPRMPLKRALHSMTAGVWGAAPEESDDEAHWCVRVADFDYSSGRVKAGPKTMRSIADSDFARKRLQYGDLLLEGSGGGDKISVGRVVVFDHDDPAVCSNFLQRLRPAPGVDSEYLAIVLRDMHSTGTVRLHIKQTTGIQNLDLGTFLAAEVPVPAEAIQGDVVRRTKDAFLENDLVLERVKREIALLQEFRTRLIADVVTGQVDVRAIASTLPEAPESIDHLIPAVDDDLEEALSEGEG